VAVTPNDPRPPYVQVADDLRAAITAGRYAAGERLPSGRDLARTYGVALMTMQRALGVLADEGYVALYKSRGAFVRSPAAEAGRGRAQEPTLDGLAEEVRDLRETMRSLEGRLAELEHGDSGA
jgi:DNA-binding GntR family transcriptional regulator